MNDLVTNRHRIDPLTRSCLGCGLAGRETKLTPDCPAFYRDLDGLSIVITTEERLVLAIPGVAGMRLAQREMFEVRDAIDEGVQVLRDGGRSKVSPE